MKKILQINNFLYMRGGDTRYMFELAKVLNSNGIDVEYFGMKHSLNKKYNYDKYFISTLDFEKLNNKKNIFNIFKVITKSTWNIEAQRKIRKLLAEYKPDVVHVHNILHHITPSIFPVIKSLGIPIILHVHDFNLICPDIYLFREKKICTQCFNNKYYNCLIHKCKKKSLAASFLAMLESYIHAKIDILKYVDKIIVPTNFVKNIFIKAKFNHINKMEVIHHFIESNRSLMRKSNNNGVLFIGRFIEEKGIRILLDAAKKLKSINFTLIGNGSLLEYINSFITYNKMSNVKIIPWMSHDELMNEIINYTCIVMPSQWYETSGLAILEAGSLGIPVIISDNTAMTELINNNYSGLIFKMNNLEDLIKNINRLFNNYELQEKLSKNLLNDIYQKYNSSTHFDNIERIYKEL